MIYVAHTFHPDGSLARTRGHIATLEDAATEAERFAAIVGGSWAVVRTGAAAYAYWLLGAHSGPAPGAVVAQGGLTAAA